MASNRLMRINEEIQKELSGMIRNLKDPRVQDLSLIHIFQVLRYGGDQAVIPARGRF